VGTPANARTVLAHGVVCEADIPWIPVFVLVNLYIMGSGSVLQVSSTARS